jgi:NAD(P) transhydrogenase subunit alpha
MKIGILKEVHPETRVSQLPEHISMLTKMGIEVLVEKGAGYMAFASDEDYSDKGAKVAEREFVIQHADVLLCLHPFDSDASGQLDGKILIGQFNALYNKAHIEKLAASGATVFSMEMLPRTTRAQSMDVLSSQANIAGYKAVLIAAQLYPRYFPMFMTAAGSIPPAKVLILGAGVAGLQAIATSRRLGAVVEVFDTRPAVKEEVMSLGAKFIEVEGAADASKAGGYAVEQSEEFQSRQKARIAESAAKADIIITTAQIPGKKAPLLITAEMIASMRKGSVIIDLAASTGGNTAVTKNNEVILHNGVIISGDSSLASTMPYDASKVYGKNLINFLALITDKQGAVNLNFEDDLVTGTCVTHRGKIVHEKLHNTA